MYDLRNLRRLQAAALHDLQRQQKVTGSQRFHDGILLAEVHELRRSRADSLSVLLRIRFRSPSAQPYTNQRNGDQPNRHRADTSRPRHPETHPKTRKITHTSTRTIVHRQDREIPAHSNDRTMNERPLFND